MHKVILPTVCVKEEWSFLFCFISLQSFTSHAWVTWLARASLLHIWVQSPHWKMSKILVPHQHFKSLGWPVFIHQIVCCIFVEMLMKGYKIVTYWLKYILFAWVCEKWPHENCTVFSKTCINCGWKNCSKNLQ